MDTDLFGDAVAMEEAEGGANEVADTAAGRDEFDNAPIRVEPSQIVWQGEMLSLATARGLKVPCHPFPSLSVPSRPFRTHHPSTLSVFRP